MINNILRELTGSLLQSISSGSPELARNGDFSQPLSTDDWIPASGTVQSIVDGRLKVENGTGGYKRSSQGITVYPKYRNTATILSESWDFYGNRLLEIKFYEVQ